MLVLANIIILILVSAHLLLVSHDLVLVFVDLIWSLLL